MKLLRCAPMMRPETIRDHVLPRDLPVSVQVAGTNGKGSTSAFLADILSAHGFLVGLYTSPHVSSFTERIQINGESISQKDLENYVQAVNEQQAGMCQSDLLFFAACNYFIDREVDFIVFETGLGGRRDSATLVPHEYGIITHIDLDHTQFLGHTIEQMTWEKSGIIKPGMTVVVYPNERMDIIRAEAKKNGAILIETAGEDLRINGREFSLPDYELFDVRLNMLGEHQIKNCVCAICTAKQMLQEGYDPQTTKAAVEKTKVFGRMTLLQENPKIIADVAHNPDGVGALCAEIDRYSGRKIAVVSIMQGKEYAPMIQRLKRSFDELIFTKAAEKAYHPAEFGEKSCYIDFDEAYTYAIHRSFDVLVFCGSFAIVNRIKEKIKGGE